jgi:DNA polymerase-3 subunit gamma/tau
MENFLVSARKYRPATFKSVVGQETITNTLKNSIRSNHLAQAFLFCGPRGVGKTTCARILAKTINCLNLTAETEPCNACESCLGFNNSASFNIHELDAASNNSVDDIRALTDQVRFAPQIGKYGVYIIDEVHMLSTAAFNAFLKTLEEPPKHAIFILATTERHKILPTILSRCQVFTFNRIQVDDIANHLAYVAKSESIEAEMEALHVIAQKADGGLRDALSMFDQIVSYSGGNAITYKSAIENLNVLDYDYFFKATDYLIQGDISKTLLLLSEVLNHGFDIANFLSGLAEHFRNLLVCQDAATLVLLEVSVGVKSKYQTQAQQVAAFTLIRGIDALAQGELGLKAALNNRLQAELTLLKLVGIFKPQPVAEEKKNPDTTPRSPLSNTASQANTVTPPEPKVPVIALRGIQAVKTSVSIKKHLDSKPADQTDLADTQEQHSISEVLPEEPFSLEALNAVWLSYTEKLKAEGKQSLCGTLTLNRPELGEQDHQIRYLVQNESQLRELEAAKFDLINFLRKQLKNHSISLMLSKSEAPIKTKLYTTEDKLKAMEASNPNITALRQALGLLPG